MSSENELYVDHEVRMRMVENAIVDIDKRFEALGSEMRTGNRVLLDKMDTQFHWILATILIMFGGVILHMAKLI
jgi:hypothetical protein